MVFPKNFFKAVNLCKGDYIFIADQDDIWLEDKVKTIVNCFANDDTINLVSHNYFLIDSQNNFINEKIPNYSNKDTNSFKNISINDFIGASPIRGCSICFKKKILTGMPTLELSNQLGHDWLICIEALLGGKAIIIERKLMSYRIHEGNVSISNKKKKLSSSVYKRIYGIEEAIKAYQFLLNQDIDINYMKRIKKQIKFEKKRLLFMKNESYLSVIYLLFHITYYNKIYKYRYGGLRVFIGDILYSYRYKV